MLESQTPGPVYLINNDEKGERSSSCRSMFDTSKRRRVSGSSRFDVHSHKPDREDRAQIYIENTFRLEPHKRFQPRRARDIAQQVVCDLIPKEASYSAEWARVTALKITDQVQTELKLQPQDRYKFVVQSFIGQKSGQGLMLGSRCLTNPDTDSSTEFNFHNSSLWCTVLVYALYCE